MDCQKSVLDGYCWRQHRRIPDLETLKVEISAWQEKRNASSQTMEWRFTNMDVRVKLKKLCPTLQE
jgi:hypothetical protein